MKPRSTRKIAIVGDYLPRKCGIATFTHSVYRSLTDDAVGNDCFIVAVNDVPEGYAYPPEVRFEIAEQELHSYRRAADFLNLTDADVVCVQHEFGIYGGPAGSHILTLLRNVHLPVVTQLHTILEEPTAEQRLVMKEVAALSTRIIVMSDRGKRILEEIYEVPSDHLDVIPHGVPDMPFVDPNYYKDQFGVEGKQVLLTFGLISPAKGIETVIRALPEVVKEFPEMVYIVLGATHPHLLREQGETYRLSLERLAIELGVRKQVIFYNRFVGFEELKDFLGVADIYITPYLNPDQITSGTLSYAFGCGKAVISTPYWHAEELLADGRGVLVPFRDSDAIAKALIGLLLDDVRRHAMRKQAYLLGRGMIWSHTATLYYASFERARLERGNGSALHALLTPLGQEPRELPVMRLVHLQRISDSTGIYQHAKYTLPNFKEGYCTDDNVRALQLLVMLEESGDVTPLVQSLATCYGSFINHAFIPETCRFHNFMSFERSWLDEDGSDDCLGRTLLALGACVGRSQRDDLRHWAADLFRLALPSVTQTTSPRAWALGLKAIHEYLRKLSGDRTVNLMRDQLTDQLLDAFQATCGDEWPWFENVLSYDNASLPHALILSGRWSQRSDALEVGLRSLRWLMAMQTAEAGHFRPIGSNGFWRRGQFRASFDQQPLEACASVSACVEAWSATGDDFWLDEAWRAFAWFLGGNDLHLPLYNALTGGCFDGLQDDSVNQNQGAESTLAFLLALQEMRLLEHARHPHQKR
ncbi:glycosyltransferase family 4 protein [Synechococcus sp. CS-1324]|uniref:glycosyltransferase family 4 protein n=1 Tax=Synechococcus sp. CS-1324 TaxID=2847980 RepID=UPI000DB2D8F2|nr:glycosyltransferase family 4 protein [Synechococcus sp. CS-1324]MCT0229603.1 glycosyltransferase family 4 protein [Synechococcus sp. CS-1324]PZV02859.1 MAG: glycosyl transferase family 1 [Cyanobium sp.]